MSNGPVEFKSFVGKNYIKLKLTSKDWCTYRGKCRIEQLALKNGTCDCCKYKRLIDIPEILERLHNDKCEVVRS
ncbi:MAG: hypothetical protein ACFFG0_00325 [Candidatus Thorarchaeota archaeon]